MTFELPKVKFEFTDFEPAIDAKTMEIHLTKHHQAYVDNLNKLTSGLADQWVSVASVEEILKRVTELPVEIKQGVINNAGGHYNHSLWWEQLKKPQEGNRPTGRLLEMLNTTFGTFDVFVELFEKAAMTRFGSGWAWLSQDDKGMLVVHNTANQDNPVMESKKPILGLDVWEHAYYLNYQNRRADYVKAFWQIVDWEVVEKRLG